MKLTYLITEGFEDFNNPDKAVLLPVKLLRKTSLYKHEPEVNVRQRNKGRTGSRTSKELERTKRKIKKIGIKHPLGLRIHDNGKLEIIDGTHRLLIASELGMPFVPVKFVPNTIEKPELIKTFFSDNNIKPKFVSVDHTFMERERKVMARLQRMQNRKREPYKPQKSVASVDDIFAYIDQLKGK